MIPNPRGERCPNWRCKRHGAPWRHDEALIKNIARRAQAALTGSDYLREPTGPDRRSARRRKALLGA